MITAIFLGFLGLFLGMVGLRCINIGGMELSRKAKLAATAGVLHILAGNWGKVVGVPCIVCVGGGFPGFPVLSSLPLPVRVSPPPWHRHLPSLPSLPSSPAHTSLTHAHQLSWLQINPSATFIEHQLGARYE